MSALLESFLTVRPAIRFARYADRLSGNVGNLPNVANMDIQYAQSCILTPCDFSFARDGIAADTTPLAWRAALITMTAT